MDEKRIVDIVRGFKNKRVGVVGDVALDSYLFGRINRVNHERPGYPLLMIEREEHRLGCAGNVAANLVSLGARVSLFGVIGNDVPGANFKRRCKKRGIKFYPAIEDCTLLKQRRIELIHNDYLGREDFGEAKLEKINRKSEDRLFSSIIKEKPEILILSDYNKRVFRGDFAGRLIKWAKEKGIKVIVDPKPQNIGSFTGATLISPNLRESNEILGYSLGEDGHDVEELAKKLKEKYDNEYVVITCGSEGIFSYGNENYKIPAETKELNDVTGAGDTVTALLGLSILSGATLEEATYIANSAAGIVVERLGTASVSQKQLIDKIVSSLNRNVGFDGSRNKD